MFLRDNIMKHTAVVKVSLNLQLITNVEAILMIFLNDLKFRNNYENSNILKTMSFFMGEGGPK